MAKLQYSVSASGKKAIEKGELGTQATLVLSVLAKGEPMVTSDLADAVAKTKKLETRQPVARVVGFYIAQFKADGLVKGVAVKAEKTEKPAKKAAKKSSKKSAEPVAA
jgi:hypothetical protein